MPVGWSGDVAVKEQIEATVTDTVELERGRLNEKKSFIHSEECESLIQDLRRKVLPGVLLCVKCQSEFEEPKSSISYFNGNGSKDIQI